MFKKNAPDVMGAFHIQCFHKIHSWHTTMKYTIKQASLYPLDSRYKSAADM